MYTATPDIYTYRQKKNPKLYKFFLHDFKNLKRKCQKNTRFKDSRTAFKKEVSKCSACCENLP